MNFSEFNLMFSNNSNHNELVGIQKKRRENDKKSMEPTKKKNEFIFHLI